ncbi:MAG TPA: hypothetical protein VH854_00240 [Thermoanaerobaculia bacterium]|jgi:hypothetical protein|nr:hypothetical protein [Thermoanaerobaculia bacterium]
MPVPVPVKFPFPFPNPATPDLGCFVRRKHELETEPFNVHVEFQPSIDQPQLRQQVYFRVLCGKAAHFQRALVLMTFDANIPPQVLQNFPPDFVLGGDFTPSPSEWFRYPMQTGTRFYWFFGQHRDPAAGGWQPDAFAGHTYDIYDNGTLSTVYYDDTGVDKDMNDLILEVAVVRRDQPDIIVVADGQLEVFARFEKEALPRLRDRRTKGIG